MDIMHIVLQVVVLRRQAFSELNQGRRINEALVHCVLPYTVVPLYVYYTVAFTVAPPPTLLVVV